MLINTTKEKLKQLKFKGMLRALEEQLQVADINDLPFEERFGFLIDREVIERENRRFQNRLRQAKLRQDAFVENIDYKNHRGLEKSVILSLASCEWINKKQNIIITGPTGAGKSYLACALAQKACREGFNSIYERLPRLFQELTIAKGDGRYIKILDKIGRVDVLILDDWGITIMNESQRKDLLEIIEDRYNTRSTIIASQLPLDKWHELIGDPIVADALLDRLIHNAHKIQMKGESMRKKINSLVEAS